MPSKISSILTAAVLVVFLTILSLSVSARAHEDNTSGVSQRPDRASDLIEKFRTGAREHNAEARLKVQAKTHIVRQKACEARKAGLERRMDRAVTQAEKHKAVFDKIYNRVKEFHDDKNLATPNYEQLAAVVDTAQSDAAASIAALDSLNFEIDCTQDNVADSVTAFKEALKETRDSLKDYRKAIVDFVKAVHQSAKESSDNSSDQQE